MGRFSRLNDFRLLTVAAFLKKQTNKQTNLSLGPKIVLFITGDKSGLNVLVIFSICRCKDSLLLIIYRDSRHEIRALCIAEMGEWMKEYW